MCRSLLKQFDSRQHGALEFDDYMRCCVTVQTMFKSFSCRNPDQNGHVQVDLEDFLFMVIETRAKPVENLSIE